MIKNILLVLAAFGAGFFVNQMIKQPVHSDNSVQCENLSTAKDNLILISQNEYLEYTKIKDLKQKYEKADELLGKVMLLFLADIGFKATHVTANDLEVKALEPESTAHKDESVKPLEAVPTAPAPVVAAVPPAPSSEGLKGKSELIRKLRSQKQINEALDKALIENPKVAVASGNPVEQRQMKVIEGSFVGEIKFFDKKREPRNLNWDLVPNYQEKPITTEFHLRMFGGGQGNSEASGKGELRHVSMLAEDPYGYMVETCGGDCYLQMYYNTVHDQFYGNYYESSKKDSKKFERVGLINLRR